MREEPLTLEAEVMSTFPLFMHKVFHDFAPDTRGHTLNRTQTRVLMIVHTHGNPHMTEVCRHLNMERGSLTPVVDELIGAGLLRRARNRIDRRKVNLALTEEGGDLVTGFLDLAQRHLDAKLRRLPAEEKRRFERAVHDLHAITKKL